MEIGDEILAVNDVPVTSVDEVKRLTVGDERSTCRYISLPSLGQEFVWVGVRVWPSGREEGCAGGQKP